MADDELLEPSIPAALGPGDDDPRSPIRIVPEPPKPPAVAVRADPPPIPAALGPGDSVGDNPDDAFHFLAPPPAGPGGVDRGALHLPRVLKRREPAARAADEEST